jgi:hypothetical protein
MVPSDGWHRQPPEHVTVAGPVSVNRYCPAAQSDTTVHVPPSKRSTTAYHRMSCCILNALMPVGHLFFEERGISQRDTVEPRRPSDCLSPACGNVFEKVFVVWPTSCYLSILMDNNPVTIR